MRHAAEKGTTKRYYEEKREVNRDAPFDFSAASLSFYALALLLFRLNSEIRLLFSRATARKHPRGKSEKKMTTMCGEKLTVEAKRCACLTSTKPVNLHQAAVHHTQTNACVHVDPTKKKRCSTETLCRRKASRRHNCITSPRSVLFLLIVRGTSRKGCGASRQE